MPELPETETIARDLDAQVAGARIVQVRVIHHDVLREVSAASFIQRTTGAAIARAWRRAKLVVVDLAAGDHVVVQPRFTGDAAGVNPSIAFLSLIFWAYLLGALGALLAIPATLFVKATLINANPRAQWFAALIDTDEEHRKKRKQDKRSRRSPRPTEREAEPADAAG